MDDGQLRKVETFAKEQMSKSVDIFHDWGHIDRVRQNALEIVDFLNYQDIDKNLLQAGCLLHDLCYRDRQTGSLYTYFFEAKKTLEILNQARLKELSFISQKEWEIITEAIKHHPLSFPFGSLNRDRNLYCQILQDADTIDFFGIDRYLKKDKHKKIKRVYRRLGWLYRFGLKNLNLFLNKPMLANKFGRVRRIPLFYKEYGKENKKTIVLITGYVGHKDEFSLLADDLGKEYRLIVINLPMAYGYFKSLKIEEMSFYIDRIVKKLNLQKFDLAGFSMGGLVAIDYASKNMEKISKLTLLSMVPKPMLFWEEKIFKIIKPVCTTKLFCKMFGIVNTNQMLRKIVGSEQLGEKYSELMKKEPVAIFSSLFENIDIDLTSTFNKLNLEKLIVMFEDDKTVKWSRYKDIKNRFKTKYCNFSKGGHNLYSDYQRQVAKLWLK